MIATIAGGCDHHRDIIKPKAAHVAHSTARKNAACTEAQASAIVDSEHFYGVSPGSPILIGGSEADGWLFSRGPYYPFVAPDCISWFPPMAAIASERIVSAQYVNHKFVLIGTGSGDVGAQQKPVPPYRVVLDPKTGLETFIFDKVPAEGMLVPIVYTHWRPSGAPAKIRSISVESVTDGFQLSLVTDIPKESSFQLGAGLLSTPGYTVEMDHVRLPSTSVPGDMPFGIRLVKIGSRNYAITIPGVTSLWKMSTVISGGTITIIFQRH